MPVYIVLTGLTSVLFFLTGLFVFLQDPHRPLYRRCFIFSASVSFWSFGYFLTLFAIPNNNFNIVASRLSHACGAFIPITYLHFVWEILKRPPKKQLFYWGYIFSAVMFLMCSTSLVVKVLLPKMGLRYYPEWGILYPVYSALFIIFPGYAQYEMGKEIFKTQGTERIRLIYFFIALGLAFSGGISLFLLIFNINFPPFTSVLIILYPPMMAYTILVHKFLDIDVIIKRTLVFAGLLTFVFAVFSSAAFVVREILTRYFGVGTFWTYAISLFFIVLGYDPIRNLLINLTDKYLFQRKYNYQKVLKDATRGMAQIKSLNHLIRLVMHFVTMKMRVKNAAALIRRRDNEYELYYQRGYEKSFVEYRLDDTNPMVSYLMLEKEAIEIDQIKEYNRDGNKKRGKGGTLREYDFQGIRLTMESLEATCVVPSFLGRDLKSILLIGEKKSGEPFTSEDLNILFTLAQESAIAIENAKLYDEALEKTKLLSKINQELLDANEKLQVTHASLIVAEKNATMVGMAKAIGHEINNPLSSVILPIERIHKKQIPKCREAFEKILAHISEEQREQTKESQEIVNKALTDIQNATMRADRSANRISAVVHTLTDILKDSKGEMGSLSFLVLCREAADASRFSTSGLVSQDIKQNIQPNLMIRGNVNQLLQVFINLVKNAFEAMDNQKDRSVIINGDYDPDNPEMALIEFIDNGPGIPPEVLPKIWMQGFSTKDMKDDSIGAAGQGQGLFVCKHVIESIHKGTITAESAPGKGTKFIIRLPLAELKENA